MTTEIWDKITPINGVSAERMLELKGFSPDDEIYLIRDADERVCYIENQHTTPFPDYPFDQRGAKQIEMLSAQELEVQHG